jgi:hypothetical protein
MSVDQNVEVFNAPWKISLTIFATHSLSSVAGDDEKNSNWIAFDAFSIILSMWALTLCMLSKIYVYIRSSDSADTTSENVTMANSSIRHASST